MVKEHAASNICAHSFKLAESLCVEGVPQDTAALMSNPLEVRLKVTRLIWGNDQIDSFPKTDCFLKLVERTNIGGLRNLKGLNNNLSHLVLRKNDQSLRFLPGGVFAAALLYDILNSHAELTKEISGSS